MSVQGDPRFISVVKGVYRFESEKERERTTLRPDWKYDQGT